MNLPSNYYHCFLGNGLDAVLIGPTGSMVGEKVGVDRCHWYKADRYYPERKLVQVAGRFPTDRPLEHTEGSGWYEIAPLGRTWYDVSLDGRRLSLQASRQRFVAQEGSLYSTLDCGPVRAQVTTFLHATRSILIEQYTFDREVEFRGWMGPGVWVEEGWDTDPFLDVCMADDRAEGRYDLGETQGTLFLHLEPAAAAFGVGGRDRWLSARGRVITKYFAIADDRQGAEAVEALRRAIERGYESLRQSHLDFWRDYFAASEVCLPDEQFQRFYDASLYHFKAMQNRESGGLPVNNLRRTWSSHVFWDSYFIQRAMLEANRRPEALEACRFLQRTLDHARRHARDEFGAEGLKWDWEITHDGRKAYGTLLHMKDQVHNNASYANMIWQYYEFTGDRERLREFYPILEGLARFFLSNVVEQTARGYEIRSLVGVHESPIRVKNEGTNLSGTIAILRHCAAAARALGAESEFSRRCAEAADGLSLTLDRLFTGRYFASAEAVENLNMSSLVPIYPMGVVTAEDARSRSTARAFTARYGSRPVGHGGNEAGFPWSAGVLATILARQGDGDAAWRIVESTRPAICIYGGMTETLEDGHWNMQYFGTAQAAVCTAIHHLMLQAHGDEIRLFPARPGAWPQAEFRDLLAAGMLVTARFEAAGRCVEVRLRNIAHEPLTRHLCFDGRRLTVTLEPDEEHHVAWRA